MLVSSSLLYLRSQGKISHTLTHSSFWHYFYVRRNCQHWEIFKRNFTSTIDANQESVSIHLHLVVLSFVWSVCLNYLAFVLITPETTLMHINGHKTCFPNQNLQIKRRSQRVEKNNHQLIWKKCQIQKEFWCPFPAKYGQTCSRKWPLCAREILRHKVMCRDTTAEMNWRSPCRILWTIGARKAKYRAKRTLTQVHEQKTAVEAPNYLPNVTHKVAILDWIKPSLEHVDIQI